MTKELSIVGNFMTIAWEKYERLEGTHMTVITFLAGFLPTGLKVSRVTGTGSKGEHYMILNV